MSVDQEIRDSENALNTAIAKDLELTYDTPVTVVGYLIAAEVLHEDGSYEVMWTQTDGMPEYRIWGMLAWLKRRFEDMLT